jgi:hypothetical protein
MSKNRDTSPEYDEAPPVFGTWKRFYAVVLVNTLAIYLLLVLFSSFARSW